MDIIQIVRNSGVFGWAVITLALVGLVLTQLSAEGSSDLEASLQGLRSPCSLAERSDTASGSIE